MITESWKPNIFQFGLVPIKLVRKRESVMGRPYVFKWWRWHTAFLSLTKLTTIGKNFKIQWVQNCVRDTRWWTKHFSIKCSYRISPFLLHLSIKLCSRLHLWHRIVLMLSHQTRSLTQQLLKRNTTKIKTAKRRRHRRNKQWNAPCVEW